MRGMEPSSAEPASFARIVEVLGLGAVHGYLARRLRAGLLQMRAVDMVDDSLAALAACEDFPRIEQAGFRAAFRRGWIDLLQGFGRDFTSLAYRSRRLSFSAACALAGIPLSLLLLQHGLIQRAVIDRMTAGEKDAPEGGALTDCLMRLGALDAYLLAEGYRVPDIDALRQTLAELREEATRLQRQATIDPLTGLVSFGSLLESLDKHITKARARGHPLCVMMADLDFFKRVNDTHGHLVGDVVLRHTAQRILAAVRDFDIVGRFGGEEFTIILKNTDLAMASIIAERIREDVAATPMHVKGKNISITISIGLAMLREGDTVETLLDRADAAMYQAKQAGRNRVVVAPE